MKMLHSLSMVAALGLAGTAYAQTASPDTTAPGTASSPHQRQATSTTAPESAPTGSTEPGAASSQHQRDATSGTHIAEASPKAGKWDSKMVGMKVQMSSGESLGEVKEVLVDAKGDASYAIISHGGVMGVGAKRAAIPWANVQALVKDDKLIMDRSQLEQAPVLSGNKTPDASDNTWSRDADAYWRTKVSKRADAPAPIPAKERT